MSTRFTGVPARIINLALVAFVLFATEASAARAEYLLQIGDRLRVTAAGVPDFAFEAAIDLDGRFRGPLIGSIPAAGATLDETRDAIARVLAGQVLNRRLTDGEEKETVIEPNEIGVGIAEYRPVSVDGDVQNPGEFPFRPGMTARHALAAAGGFNLLRVRAADPVLLHADYRGEYERLALELVRLQATRHRLGSERSEEVDLEDGRAAPGSFTALMHDLEQDRFRTRAGSFAADRDALDAALRQLRERENYLVEQLAKQTAAADADSAYEAESRTNLTLGIVPVSRVVEAQRFALASAAQVQGVAANIAGVRREIEQLSRERTRLGDDRRLDVLAAVQEVEARIAEVEARMRIVREQIARVGGMRVHSWASLGEQASITIHRSAGKEGAVSEPDFDTSLLPGDLIEFTLLLDVLGQRS